MIESEVKYVGINVMTRRSKHGVKPTIFAREMNDPWKPDTSSWARPIRPLDNTMRRKLFAALVCENIRFVMKQHLFRFGERMYRQLRGGSIGSILTGEVAKARTIIFLRKFKAECVRLGLKLFLGKIFVDDVLPLARFSGSGMMLKEGNLVWDPE